MTARCRVFHKTVGAIVTVDKAHVDHRCNIRKPSRALHGVRLNVFCCAYRLFRDRLSKKGQARLFPYPQGNLSLDGVHPGRLAVKNGVLPFFSAHEDV